MKLRIKITEADLQEMQRFKEKSYLEGIPNLTKRAVYWRSVYTITVAEIRRNLRVWVQNIVSPMLNAVLYFLVFGLLLGNRIGEIHGIPYLHFIIPGFIAMPMVNASFANGAYKTFMDIYFKNIQEVQRAPVSASTFIFGVTLATLGRVAIVTIMIYVVSVLFTGSAYIAHPLYLLIMIMLVTAVFTLVGMINGLKANSFEELNFVPTFILQPLIYLSGVFIPINSLPWLFAKLSLLNPLSYIMSGLRFSFLGFSDIGYWICVSFLVVVAVICFFIVRSMLQRKLNLH